jgi:acyl-CoA synthetase (AMP-forming)/AMP-acid ligase II
VSVLRTAEALDRVLALDPSRLALLDDRMRLSWSALDDAVSHAAAVLHALGVREGERVAVSLPNSALVVVLFLASQRLGAIWVGINTVLAPPEKRHILQDCAACLLLASPNVAADQDAFALPTLRRVVECDVHDPTCEWQRLVREVAARSQRADIDPHAPAAIAYTSGTTGFPKGAVHSQHNLMLMGHVARVSGFYPEHMPHGVMLPLTTLNLLVLVPLLTLQNGAPCVVLDGHKPEYVARRIGEERIGHLTAVPVIYHDLFAHAQHASARLESLVRPEIGGAHVPPALRELYRVRFGTEICVGYGMTEAPATVTRTQSALPYAPGLCGEPLPQYRIEIRDERDRLMATDESGEICVAAADRGAFAGAYTSMLGYWNNPQATRAALRNGRYYTGDLGLLDVHGRLFVLGRKTEVIVRGGANVYPAEVERVLHDFPGVVAAAVLGEPDERLGETVIAYVQMEPGQALEPAQLRAFCGRSLARYKVPIAFRSVDVMPRNAMGKIVKTRLKEPPIS